MNKNGCHRFVRHVLGLCLLGAACCVEGPAWADESPVEFARDVKPILAEHCWSCHGGDEPEGGLRLTERDNVLMAGESGRRAVVPGKPEESELIRRIRASDSDVRMPPEGEEALTAEQISVLERWVAQGATWSRHWSLEPLSVVAPPAVRDVSWIRNEIDRFVLARLEARGWTPSPEADRATLIKRLYYDLLGLPPTPAEVDAFLADESPLAYEKLVDRLLGSPHFGERWGRHWLDAAHYADSDGYEKDRARPDAYVYRDWVIDAFNHDMPFDQFTIEQLAGDLLPGSTPRQRIATAFLRQTLTNEEGGVDQEEYRIAAVFDRTETVGTVWLALTIGCARCHEHKYDPLRHEDYYQLFAFFNNADELTTPLPIAADDLDALARELAPLEVALAARYRELAPACRQWETEQHQLIMATPDGPLREMALNVVTARAESGAALIADGGALHVFASSAESAAEKPDSPDVPERDVYRIEAVAGPAELTGFKLWALADDRLPGGGPGRAPNGNFVLTGFRVTHVAADGTERTVGLHRAEADFVQKGFSAAVPELSGDAARGWAVGGKLGVDHWLQFRTQQPLVLREGDRLRFELSQQHGGAHTLGRFRLAGLTGDARGIQIPDKQIADYLEMYPEKRVASVREKLFDYFVTQVARDEAVKQLRAKISDVLKAHHARQMDIRTITTPRLPRETFVFHRGDFLSPTSRVEPNVPEVLPPLRASNKSHGAPSPQPTRLDLARWLVGSDNFLTPRVAVNDVWLHLFGEGLVRTPNDFGARGEPPTHPELLDWLARRFQVDFRWSRKALIRYIVHSATYRQASRYRPEYEVEDSGNRLLFRQNRFRVEAEIVRDAHLAVSGLLSEKIGGPSVFPPMPEDLAKLSYANNFSWSNSKGADRYRRGMYTFFKRTIPHPNLMTFDAPDANVACIRRVTSNTPLQALTLLNNETHVEAAQAMARRVLSREITGADQADAQRLAYALRLCVARRPEPPEIDALGRVLRASRAYYADRVEEARQLAGKNMLKGVSPSEIAAWVVTVRTVLNLDEFVTRE